MKKVMKVIAAGIVCTCIFCFGKAIRDKTAKVYQQFCEETEPEEWIDFNYWQNRNADVYAWIRIPGTKIDYPVVQGDEDGYYLSHDIDKESNIYGAIYTEKVNGKDFSSPNTVLYGHHMKDGSMFGCLDKYLDRDYFEKYNEVFLFTPEDRNPTMTEIRVLDTYWSDHCRHTTFSTELKDVKFDDGDYRDAIEDTYKEYLKDHSEIFKGREDKFVCLMDLALMAMRRLKKEGKLADQEESDEINACSIVVPIKVDGVEEEWLINFKNETHNHPTEIEPFGGAATCLGGAIRDPLSGRTYVYQAMRVTGAADPTVSANETLKGKLPQKKLVREAAHGYSSYGNQIGLATGLVKEIYHPDYVAKRMEIVSPALNAAPYSVVLA